MVTLRRFVLVSLLAGIHTGSATAADTFYTGSSGNWATTDWSLGVQPIAADRANVNNGETVTITTDVGTINSMRIGVNGNSTDGNGTIIIDGGQLTISDTGGTGADIRIGENTRTGTLTILNGGSLTADNAGGDGQIYLGTTGNGNGIVDVQNGTITAERGFYVGGDSTATSRVNTTGTFTLGDGSGSGDAVLTTSGGNTEVGYGGMGTMTINSDGVLNQNTNNLVIGQGSASVGIFIMNGGAATMHPTGDVNLNAGTQTVTINDGTLTARAFNQNSLAGKASTTNLNGGFVSLSADFTDRDGESTVNYNGSRVVVGGNDFAAEFLNVGSDSAISPSVTMNLVAAATGLNEFQAPNFLVKRDLTLANTGVTATLNIDNGTVDVVRNLIDGGGTSALNVGTTAAGTLRIAGLNPAAVTSTRLDTFSVAANGTLSVRPNAFGVNTILTEDANLTGGTLTVDTAALNSASNNGTAFETVWLAGSGEWASNQADWSRGLPDGYTIGANTNMTVVDSTNPITGTINLTTADWTLQDDGTTTGQVVISNDAAITVGQRRAVLTGGGSTVEVTRATDLIIANTNLAGAVGTPHAARLQILPDANLTIGTPSTNANFYVGGGSNAAGTDGIVDQQGDVTVNGDLFFGQRTDGVVERGGTYNVLPGAMLKVTGSIIEVQNANGAQFYIRGGTVDVDGDITVQRLDLAGGSSQTSQLNIKPGQTVRSTGTTQIGGASRGRIVISDSTSVLAAANMTIGAGNNSNDSWLEVRDGLGGTFGGSLTLGNNAGGNTGPQLRGFGMGVIRISQNGNIQNPASGNADLNVNSGNTTDILMNDDSLLDVGRNFNLHNSTTTNHSLDVDINDRATLRVVNNLNFRNGTSRVDVREQGTINIGNDLLLDAGTGLFRVEGSSATVTVGNNVTQTAGQNFDFAFDAGGIAPIAVNGGGVIDLAGNINVETDALTSAAGAAGALSTWSVGNGNWTTSDAEWLTGIGEMLNPDGRTITSGDRFTIFEATGGTTFGASTPTVTNLDFTFDSTADPTKGDLVYAGADINSLPLHAVLDDAVNGGPLTVTRSSDLQIAPVVGADASQLTIEDDVTLDITDGATDPNLVIGSGTDLGIVDQNGGTVNIDGALVFGTGASSFGGTYNLNGGTLNVGGDVIEGSVGGGVDTSVDNAQLYINGGTLNVTGTNINVQSFRVAQAANSNATVTLTNKVVASSGESHVGDDNGSVGVLNLLGTTTYTSGSAFFIGGDSGADGTLNLGDGTDSPSLALGGTSDLEIGFSGTGRVNVLSGTVTAPGGIDIAANTVGTGFLTVGDGTSNPILNVSGGNLETAVNGTGTVTWNSGTLNQTTNNLIVAQGTTSNATFILNDGLIDLTNQLRMNNGTGRVIQNGGTMNVGTRLDMENGTFATSNMTYEMKGGTLNVADRAIDDLVIGNTDNATSTSTFIQTGGTVNVARHVYAGNDATGILTVDDPSAVLNIGYNYGGGVVDLASARLFVANLDNGDGSQANLTRGSVNIGGGLWAGTAGATGSVTIGAAAGNDNDTTIRVGIAGTDGNAQTRVGLAGTGTFTLESGRYYQETQNFVIASNAAGTGTVNVNGGELNVGFDQPTMTNNGTSDLTFGDGTGTFTQNGGTVQVADRLIYSPADGSGTVNANGGTMSITNGIDMSTEAGGSAAFNIGGGTVNLGGDINYGAGLGNDSISLTSGTLNFTQPGGGTITAHNARDSFTFSGGTLQNLGTFNGYDASASPETGNLGTGPSDALLAGGIESAFGTGKVGNGIGFDTNLGNNEHVNFGDARFGNPRAFSVAIWFNRSQENNGTTTNHNVNNVLMAQSSSPVNDNFEIGTQGNNLELYIDTNGSAANNPAADFLAVDLSGIGSGIVNGQWHHVVVSYDGDATTDRLNVFFDGQEVTGFDKNAFTGVLQSADSTTAADSPFTLGLARPDGNNWGDFSGTLDEFAAWNSVIGASDVADLYNGGAGNGGAAILGSAAIYTPFEGQLAGNLTMLSQTGGTLAPGLATGSNTDQIGQSIINAGYEFTAGLWDFDLMSNGSVSNDSINVNGTLTLGGTSTLGLTLLDWSNLSDADVFVVADYTNLSGTFGSVDFSDLISKSGLDTWMIDYNFGGANQIAILVPEPSRFTLLGLGLTALILRRRRK